MDLERCLSYLAKEMLQGQSYGDELKKQPHVENIEGRMET